MPNLHDLLVGSRDELIDRCIRESRTNPAVELTAQARSLESLPVLLDELVKMLEGTRVDPSSAPSPPPQVAAEAQASERDDDDWDVIAALRMHKTLFECILARVEEENLEIGMAEQRALLTLANEAAVQTVVEYTRQRDEELRKKSALAGMALVGHELRNPLNSAMMALGLFRSSSDPEERGRLLDMLERNLRRLQNLIDEAMTRAPPPTAAP